MSALSLFVTGGPIPRNSNMYIERRADEYLGKHLMRMEYIALIEPHQQGKTSLIWRMMQKYSADRNYSWIYTDMSLWTEPMSLTKWQTVLKDWISKRIQESTPSFYQMLNPTIVELPWKDFLEELSKKAEDKGIKLVIVFDEVAALPSDCIEGIFQPIRAIYNLRMAQTYYEHLNFVISCAYHPALLSQDSALSHILNLCQRININDFSLEQVKNLVEHIPNINPDNKQTIAARIHYWVDGQPFLTQWLCSHVFNESEFLVLESVDKAVFKFVQGDIHHWTIIERKLRIYSDLRKMLKSILDGEQKAFNPSASSDIQALQLMGLVKADEQNFCKIRNRLYKLILKEQRKYDEENDSSTATSQIDAQVNKEKMNLKELSQKITKCFNDSELRSLCFGLDIDYDSLVGEGKSGKARELVAYLQRRNCLPDLITICRRERPNVLW